MNKIFSYSLILLSSACLFTSCSHEEDDIFDKSAAERLNEASELYTQRLLAADNGWIMQYYPQNSSSSYIGTGYLFGLQFKKDMSVTVSMNNWMSDNKYMEDTSDWEVITDNGPVLSFNSFNDCLHAFSTPETVVLPNGSYSETGLGTGMGGDYEFIVTEAPEDGSYVMLKGKKRGTYNLLTQIPAGTTAEEYIADLKTFTSTYFPSSNPTFDVLHKGDARYKVEGSDSICSIYPYDGDIITESSYNPFLITKSGDDYVLRFRDAIEDGEVSVQTFKYDSAKDQFVSTDNEAYYLEGNDPGTFFEYSINEGNRAWNLKWTSEMSEKMKTIYGTVRTSFSNMKYDGRKGTLNGIYVKQNKSGQCALYVSYKFKNSSTGEFFIKYSQSGDKATFSYQGCSESDQSMYDTVEGLPELINVFNGQFTVSKTVTAFNLRTIKLTSVSDPDIWFIVSL